MDPSFLPRLNLKGLGLFKARCLCNPWSLLISSLKRLWDDEKSFPNKDDNLTRIGPHGKRTLGGPSEFFHSSLNINMWVQIRQSFVQMPESLPQKGPLGSLSCMHHSVGDPEDHFLTENGAYSLSCLGGGQDGSFSLSCQLRDSQRLYRKLSQKMCVMLSIVALPHAIYMFCHASQLWSRCLKPVLISFSSSLGETWVSVQAMDRKNRIFSSCLGICLSFPLIPDLDTYKTSFFLHFFISTMTWKD